MRTIKILRPPLLEVLSEQILWDADYENEDLYVDKQPDEAEVLKQCMGVLDDYFLEVPEDLKADEIKNRLLELKRLCRSVCEKNKAGK